MLEIKEFVGHQAKQVGKKTSKKKPIKTTSKETKSK